MKLQKQLLEAVEHKQLRPLDVQFALTVKAITGSCGAQTATPAGCAICPDRGGR